MRLRVAPALRRTRRPPAPKLDILVPETEHGGARFEVRIDWWLPATKNKLLQVHWGERRARKESDLQMIAWACRYWGVTRAIGPRRVSLTVTLPKGQRRFDRDAFWLSLLDALVRCRALVNDSPKWCSLGEVEQPRGEWLCTTILLEDIHG